jgi:hypothetical protein
MTLTDAGISLAARSMRVLVATMGDSWVMGAWDVAAVAGVAVPGSAAVAACAAVIGWATDVQANSEKIQPAKTAGLKVGELMDKLMQIKWSECRPGDASHLRHGVRQPA